MAIRTNGGERNAASRVGCSDSSENINDCKGTSAQGSHKIGTSNDSTDSRDADDVTGSPHLNGALLFAHFLKHAHVRYLPRAALMDPAIVWNVYHFASDALPYLHRMLCHDLGVCRYWNGHVRGSYGKPSAN